MTNFTWDGEPDGSASDGSDSGLAQLGLEALVASEAPTLASPAPATPVFSGPVFSRPVFSGPVLVSPAPSGQPLSSIAPPAPNPTLRAVDVAAPTVTAADLPPLSRRELRELERAAALRAEASAGPRIVDAPAAMPDVFKPEVFRPEVFTLEIANSAVVESQSFDAPVLESMTVSSAITPVVATRQVVAANQSAADTRRMSKKSRSAKASRRFGSSRAADPRNPGRTHEPAIVQAAMVSAAARVTLRASHKKPFKRRMLSKLISGGAMVGAALMIVSTSVPANAFFPTEASMPLATAAPVAKQAQSVESATLASEAPAVSRDSYSATSLKEQIFLQYGNRNYSYTPDPNGTIRWPFPIAVPISDGYGPRAAPCPGCSTFHHGVDFTPGIGTAVGVIADGVVIGVNDLDWSFGQHVLVDHVINGVHIQTLYAHMETGSIRVTLGQVLKVGDEVGQVGSTGQSTGAHLHFEVHINGQPVDPFAWLQANAH